MSKLGATQRVSTAATCVTFQQVEVEIPRIPSSTGSFWPAHLNDYTPSFEEDSLTMQQVLHRGPLPDDHHVNVRRSIEDPNWRPMRRLSRFSWAR